MEILVGIKGVRIGVGLRRAWRRTIWSYPQKAKIETRGTVASSQAFDIARGMQFFRLNGRGRNRPCWPVLAASKEDIRTVRGRKYSFFVRRYRDCTVCVAEIDHV